MTQVDWWDKVQPEAARMSTARLDGWRDALAARETKSLLLLRGGHVVYEWHAANHGPEKPHYSASLAKALVSGLALLLAMGDGLIDINAPAHEYIPAWRGDPLRGRITIRHLATHTAGLEDAETVDYSHLDQGGWKEAFWRREPDPFSIAIEQAPLIFVPGTRFAYSNPGIAALNYAVTYALRGTTHPDIRSLLKARIFDPLGIPEAEWSIGYGETHTVDDLPLVAGWGGGSFTARAVARIGQLLLANGQWAGQQLLDPEWLRQMTLYGATPLPRRSPHHPFPATGLSWWTNDDGYWDALPRDAYLGAGAGNQHLLVIPSRDLILVRNGGQIGTTFWGGAYRHLFTALMDTFVDHLPEDWTRAPCPRSETLRVAGFEPVSSIRRAAFDSDNWPCTWAADDHIYTAYGDGFGFEPYTETKLGLGFARVEGGPEDWQGLNIRSVTGENSGYGPNGAKASGILALDDTLYIWVRNVMNSQLGWSRDGGATWHWADWRFTTSFGHPTFLNFGRGYAGARDGYVYIYSHDGDSAYVPADRMVLARVPRDQLRERTAYQFFAGIDSKGAPTWTAAIDAREAVFTHPGRCLRGSVSYNAGLGRYLWWQSLRADGGPDTRFCGGFGLYEAPAPWGPWQTVYFTEEWDTGPGELACFPTRWMAADGRTCWLVFSGYDYFSVRQVEFAPQP